MMHHAHRNLPVRNGFVSLVVMISILLITYACYRFAATAVSEHRLASAAAERTQLDAASDSAEALLVAILTSSDRRNAEPQSGDPPQPADAFANIQVGGALTSSRAAHFTIIGQTLDRTGNVRLQYGPVDESARLSLGALAEWELRNAGSATAALAALPGIDPNAADALWGFISGRRARGQDRPGWGGVSLDELLQAPGMTRRQLYGDDRNRNGVVSAWESESNRPTADGAASGFAGNLSQTPLAWLLTPYSAERNTNHLGQPRVFLNMADLAQLERELSARLPSPWVRFIMAYRRGGAAALAAGSGSNNLHLIESVYDLIGAQLSAGSNDDSAALPPNPFLAERAAYREYLLRLVDEVTVDQRPVIPGRININLAPVEVLRTIPGMDEELIQRIVAARDRSASDLPERRRHAAWLVAEGWIEPAWMRELEPYVTAGGDIYRAQIVAFFAPGKDADLLTRRSDEEFFVRREVIVDVARATPRVTARRYLTSLGRGYSMEALAP